MLSQFTAFFCQVSATVTICVLSLAPSSILHVCVDAQVAVAEAGLFVAVLVIVAESVTLVWVDVTVAVCVTDARAVFV